MHMRYELQKQARKKVKSLRKLYIHMSLYAIIGIFFFLLNTATSPFQMWWFFPLLPWGVVLSLHYILVKGIPGSDILSPEWEEREYERQLDRLSHGFDASLLDEGKEDHYLPYSELSAEEIAILRQGIQD